MGKFRCFYVNRGADQAVASEITERDEVELPNEQTLIRVHWSSLNYKDGLAATGHPGVARTLPHIPGIDAAGQIVESDSPDLQPGDEVLVTGYELGAAHWGGWSELIRVPSDWVIAKPKPLSAKETMMLGTAGFTAAQGVRELMRNDVTPDKGPIVVTGSTGGVGCLAIKLLVKIGYRVFAVTGKSEGEGWLKNLGVEGVLRREEVMDDGKRPMLSTRWAGGIDTVGGPILANILKSTEVNGCVAACGMLAGVNIPISVFPFILRGVRLAGITSSLCPRSVREELWPKLANEWKIDDLESISREVELADLPVEVDTILKGGVKGRVVVRVSEES